jgi:hypothetical protein
MRLWRWLCGLADALTLPPSPLGCAALGCHTRLLRQQLVRSANGLSQASF